MPDVNLLEKLQQDLAAAVVEIERLKAIEAIRDCVYRVCRGTDRIDPDIMRSAFHPNATIRYGKMFNGGVEEFIAAGMKHQASQQQRQHLVGNVFIRISADTAFAESYELDRHKTIMQGEVRDLVIGARTLDRFEKRFGEWKIADRTKIMDWGRIIMADDSLYNNSLLSTGLNDNSDLSYELFNDIV